MGLFDFLKKETPEKAVKPEVFLYTLSTCGACRSAKALLRRLEIPFNHLDVDMLSAEAEAAALAEMRQHNPAESFPTLIIGGRVVVGYLEQDIRSAAARLGR